MIWPVQIFFYFYSAGIDISRQIRCLQTMTKVDPRAVSVNPCAAGTVHTRLEANIKAKNSTRNAKNILR